MKKSSLSQNPASAAKRISLALCAAALLLFPAAGYGANPSASGGGRAEFDFGFAVFDWQFSLNAVTHRNGRVSGHMNLDLKAPLDLFLYGGWTLKARTRCLAIVSEDIATLSGVTVRGWNGEVGEPIPPGLCWIAQLYDGGQGANADPDFASYFHLLPCDAPEELCKMPPTLPVPGLSPFGVVTRGNIQIRP